jgi:hypothetical protein
MICKDNIKMQKLLIGLFIGIVSFTLVSAGIGIKSYQDSVLLNEGEEGCVTVGAYNPFPTETNVVVGLSDSFKEILTEQEAETKYLPPGTSSNDAIPLKFCFKVPKVYAREYASVPLIGRAIDELKCTEPLKVYEGEISLQSIPVENQINGVGGSSTKMSVSRPLRIGVNCNPYPRNYMPLYIAIALVSVLIIFFVLFMRYRKPATERDREKLRKLQERIKKESPKKKR